MTGTVLTSCVWLATLSLAEALAISSLKICHSRDPELARCLKQSFNTVMKTAKNGSEELGLVPLDPFHIPLLELNLGQGNVSVDVIFRDVSFIGLSLSDVISVKANVDDRKLEVSSKVPLLQVMGQFHMEGSLLSFPIYAEGQFRVNTTDMVTVLILYYNIEDGRLGVESLNLDLIPSHITYDFGKYLDGDNKLGEGMNWFLNENSHEVFTAMKPRVLKMLGDVVGGVIDRVLRKFPAEALLPN